MELRQAPQPTFIYRGKGLEFCVSAHSIEITHRAPPATHTIPLDTIRDVWVDDASQLVLRFADGSSSAYDLGSAVDRARDAIIRQL